MKDIKTLIIGFLFGGFLVFLSMMLFNQNGKYQGFADADDRFLINTRTGELYHINNNRDITSTLKIAFYNSSGKIFSKKLTLLHKFSKIIDIQAYLSKTTYPHDKHHFYDSLWFTITSENALIDAYSICYNEKLGTISGEHCF